MYSICLISLQTQPQNKNRKFQNYISVLSIVNYRNWLDASPPLKSARCRQIPLE